MPTAPIRSSAPGKGCTIDTAPDAAKIFAPATRPPRIDGGRWKPARLLGVGGMAAVFAAVLGACAGAEPEPHTPPVAPAPLSKDVAKLRLFVVPTGHTQVDAALQSALVSAGFRVETEQATDQDLEVRATMSAAVQQQLFVANVNGVSNQRCRVTLRATLNGPGGVVDQATAAFTAVCGEVTERDLAPIAAAFTRSAKLRAVGAERTAADERKQQAKEEAEAKREADEKAKIESNRKRKDENAWIAANEVACREPRRTDACDGVQRYLADFPDGAHADEAKRTLEKAKPKLEMVQKDENAWASAGVQTCRRSQTRDACAGVEIYRTKFPAGLHADEAASLLEGL